jgi:hypothetical protein
VAFNLTEAGSEQKDIQVMNQFVIVFLLWIQNAYILSTSYFVDLVVRSVCVALQIYSTINFVGENIPENMIFCVILIYLVESPMWLIARSQGDLFYKQHMYKL